MYHVSAHGVDERMIYAHYYYCYFCMRAYVRSCVRACVRACVRVCVCVCVVRVFVSFFRIILYVNIFGRIVLYMCVEYYIYVNMYHMSAQGVDERMINAHYYYYYY